MDEAKTCQPRGSSALSKLSPKCSYGVRVRRESRVFQGYSRAALEVKDGCFKFARQCLTGHSHGSTKANYRYYLLNRIWT